MLKESILFVASTGVLIYMLVPSNEPPAEPAAPMEERTAKPPAQTSDDGWGYDEEDEADENFTFGEPMMDPDVGNDKTPAAREDRSASSNSAASADRPDKPTSIYNPIVVKPRHMPSTEDQ